MKKRLRKVRHAVSMSTGIVLSFVMWMPTPASAYGNTGRLVIPDPPVIEMAIDFTVAGKIRDENGAPVPGANVLF